MEERWGRVWVWEGEYGDREESERRRDDEKLSRERVKLLNLLSSFLLLNGGQNLPPVVVRSSREVVYIVRIVVQALWGNIVKVKPSNVWA